MEQRKYYIFYERRWSEINQNISIKENLILEKEVNIRSMATSKLQKKNLKAQSEEHDSSNPIPQSDHTVHRHTDYLSELTPSTSGRSSQKIKKTSDASHEDQDYGTGFKLFHCQH